MSRSWTKTIISSICITAVATIGYALFDQAYHSPVFYGLMQNSNPPERLHAQ